MRKYVLLLTVLLLIFSVAANAGDKLPSGKKLFKANCKICHAEDSEFGEYTPMYLIIEQWEEFYDKIYLETHGKVLFSKEDTLTVPEVITDEMLKKIRKFSIDGAADSEHPMTCG